MNGFHRSVIASLSRAGFLSGFILVFFLISAGESTVRSETVAAAGGGVVVIDAPSGPGVTTSSTEWSSVPNMVADVTLGATSDLTATFCGEATVTTGERLFLRATIDGTPAGPNDVVLVASPRYGTRCFTFVKNALPAGTHVVRIEWLVDSGGIGLIGDRTLDVTWAQADAEELVLLAVAAPSGPDQWTEGGWSDIPDMSGTIQLAQASNLAIRFSVEADTTNGRRLFVRALVDGEVSSPSDQVLVAEGYTGTSVFTFVKQNAAAGSHQIRLQWLVDDGGQGRAGDRTLQVVGVPVATARHVGALFLAAPSGAPEVTTSTSWAPMPGMAGSVFLPAAGDLTIRLSAELWGSSDKRVFVRALVDGKGTSPSDAVVITGGGLGSRAFSFVHRNVSRGSHSIQLQWLTDAGGQATVGDRTLTVYSFAQPYQTTWMQLPDIDSNVSPALSSHVDGKIYAVAVAFNGLVGYSATSAPGDWAEWQIIGPPPNPEPLLDQAFYADPQTAPILVRDGDTLYLIVRGRDDNLHESHKTGTSSWSAWKGLTNDGVVQGRISVAFTHAEGTRQAHVVYPIANNTVEYRRFGADWAQTGAPERWTGSVEATLASDGVNEVWAAIRSDGRNLNLMKKNRPWDTPWKMVTGVLADGSAGALFDISNLVYFGGAYHLAYSIKYLCDDVSGSYCHSLVHKRVRAGLPDDGYVRVISDYSPLDDTHPQAELAVYRNKLVLAYKDELGRIRYAYWDNADSETPWIGRDIVDGSSRSDVRPALAAHNARAGAGALSGADFLEANFGNDLFAAINDMATGGIWFINFSRAFSALRIDGIGLAVRWCTDYVGELGSCPDVGGLPAVSEAPVFSEVGYGTMTAPDWLMSRIYWRGLAAGGIPTGRYYTWIHTQGIRPYIGPNLNIDYLSDYLKWWEEMGHSLTGGLGLCDDGFCPDGDDTPATNLMSDFIPNSARDDAFTLFNERVNSDCLSNEPDDTCPATRVRGFTGIAGNYDVSTRQHSWMYVLYYHISDGDRLRAWIADDRLNGTTDSERTLLQRKYDWIKEYIFQGTEFRRDSEPLVPVVNSTFLTAVQIGVPSFQWYQNTLEALSEPSDPVIECGDSKHDHTVWFAYQPPGEGTVRVNTAGSDYNTVLAAWVGELGALEPLGCNDDVATGDQTSQLSFEVPAAPLKVSTMDAPAGASAGQLIYLEVAAFEGSPGGQLAFEVVFNGPPGQMVFLPVTMR